MNSLTKKFRRGNIARYFNHLGQWLRDTIFWPTGTFVFGAACTMLMGVILEAALKSYSKLCLILFILPWCLLSLVTLFKQNIASPGNLYFSLAWYCFVTLFAFPAALTQSYVIWAVLAGICSWYLWWQKGISVENLQIQIISDIKQFLAIDKFGKLVLRFILVYSLAIFIYAILYHVLYLSNTSSFNSAELNFIDFIYFSAVTITTLGYGDIYPKSSGTRILVSTEVLIGLFIVAVYLGSAVSYFTRKDSDH